MTRVVDDLEVLVGNNTPNGLVEVVPHGLLEAAHDTEQLEPGAPRLLSSR